MLPWCAFVDWFRPTAGCWMQSKNVITTLFERGWRKVKADPSFDLGLLEAGIIDGKGVEPGLVHVVFVEPDTFDPLSFQWFLGFWSAVQSSWVSQELCKLSPSLGQLERICGPELVAITVSVQARAITRVHVPTPPPLSTDEHLKPLFYGESLMKALPVKRKPRERQGGILSTLSSMFPKF